MTLIRGICPQCGPVLVPVEGDYTKIAPGEPIGHCLGCLGDVRAE